MELVRMQTEIDSLGYGDSANPVGLRGLFATPRFLSKIFDMVEDPNTDSLVSWSSNGASFVIWDHNRFAAELLPKFFRHSNLASFIYQLNNYGFRKVNTERHEYENQWFRQGKKDWLRNIRSRVQISKMLEKNGSFTAPVVEDLDVVMKKLKAEQIALRVEIQKLKEQQEKMEKELARVQEMENSDNNGDYDEERVISSFSLEFLKLVKRKAGTNNDSGSGKKKKSDGDEEGVIKCPDEEKKEELENARNAENSAFWKKIFEDDFDAEENGVEEVQPLKDLKIMVELDDMMASKIAMEEEDPSLISKVAGLEGEENHEAHLQLWT